MTVRLQKLILQFDGLVFGCNRPSNNFAVNFFDDMLVILALLCSDFCPALFLFGLLQFFTRSVDLIPPDFACSIDAVIPPTAVVLEDVATALQATLMAPLFAGGAGVSRGSSGVLCVSCGRNRSKMSAISTRIFLPFLMEQT